jgi:betaine lipid synthase
MSRQGSIPYVPYLRAPYYVWVGRVPQIATVLAENKVEAPAMFPPTFLYTTSWEDPRPDIEVPFRPLAPLENCRYTWTDAQ